MSHHRIVILISGRGSNMQAIVQACKQQQWPAEIVAVCSDRADAPGLAWAAKEGIAVASISKNDYTSREAFDAAMAQIVRAYQPTIVLLAGYMRILTPAFVEEFMGILWNIHPSLLPLFPGLHTHQKALASGMQIHGATVHLVTPELDAGPILAQTVIPVLAEDTPDTLAQRLLPLEHRLYITAITWIVYGKVQWQNGQLCTVDLPSRYVQS